MSRKNVAVLDVRSSDVNIVVGERGINNTFVFGAMHSELYGGYENGQFYDVDSLKEAIVRAIAVVERSTRERIRELYIGVPGEFSKVLPKEQTVVFPKKRKVGERDLDALFERGEEKVEGYRCIRATSMIYVTADNRRVVDPIGISTTSLNAVMSYIYCSEYFGKIMEKIFTPMRISLRYLPTELAMATYLIPSETRDEYAIFFDSGMLSSTFLVMLGGGVLVQRTCFQGKAQIAALLSDQLNLPYPASLELMSHISLFSKGEVGKRELSLRGRIWEVDMDKATEIVREGLDDLCGVLNGFLEEFSGKELDNKPLLVSGDGILDIRGALEHISRRIQRVTDVLVPELPFYNRPSMSSRIALVDMAYEDRQKGGLFYRMRNGFGG